jgi:hypothetical protein
MWLLGSPHTDIVSVHLVTDVECGFNGDQSFYETIFLNFQLHLLAKFSLFTLSAGVRACTSRILYGLKHSRLCITFHTDIFGMPNSLLALAIDLRGDFAETPHALFQCCQTHEAGQDSCLHTSIQFPQTVGTTWLHYSCVVRLF